MIDYLCSLMASCVEGVHLEGHQGNLTDIALFVHSAELAGGVSTDWNSLFNGQLDCFDTPAPDPMTGIQNSSPGMQNGLGMGLNSPTANTLAVGGAANPSLPGMDG